MSLAFTVSNFDRNIKETSSLAADIAAGATSLTLVNNQNITISDPVLVGRPGSEGAEIVTVQSVSGAQVVTAGQTKLQHLIDDAVTALFGDKIKLYKAPNVDGSIPADGTFTVVNTFNLDSDSMTTTVSDPSGTTDSWYKYTYFNSVTSIETPLADSIPSRPTAGGYVSLNDIRDRSNFTNNRNITDIYISGFRDTAQRHVDSQLSGIYSTPFTAPIDPLISEVTKMYAAGLVLNNQFPGSGRGDSFIKWADDQLASIKNGQSTLTSPLATGGSAVNNGGVSTTDRGFSGYPNAPILQTETQFGLVESEGFMFERNFIDGYNERQY